MPRHLFRPLDPSTYAGEAEERAPHYVQAWKERYPDAVAKTRDFEDWAENASVIVAANELDIDLVDAGPRPSGYITSSRHGIASGNEGPIGFFHAGIAPTDSVVPITPATRLIAQDQASLRGVSELYNNPLFLELAGRPIQPAPAVPDEIDRIVRDMVPGEGSFFIKSVEKEFAQKVDIEAGEKPWTALCRQIDGIEWDPVSYEGDKLPRYLIQGLIEPGYEYRCFMVDGKVATAAGCVEHFTPINNEAVFDNKMEPYRNRGDLMRAEKLSEEMIERANAFGQAWANQGNAPKMYSLDLCVDRLLDRVVGIELNPPMNLGRYASSSVALMRSIDVMLVKAEQLERQQKLAASLSAGQGVGI